MVGTFWALVPPIVAIVLALITKETYSSLFIGIVVGSLFVGGFNPIASLDTMINDGFIGAIADGWNAGIFMFLVLLGIMVALVNAAGGSAAFGRAGQRRRRLRRLRALGRQACALPRGRHARNLPAGRADLH